MDSDEDEDEGGAMRARLRRARLDAGLSLRQAAGVLGWSAVLLGEHERGVSYLSQPPTDLDLARYARCYGVSVRHLRDGTPPATDADGRRAFGARWDALSPQGRADALRCLDLARAGE